LLSDFSRIRDELCEQVGIAGPDAMLSAAAVGLVTEVWRNSPVENMHAGRRGPSDAAMLAESTSLHDAALGALTADNRSFGLLDFERHLLDRERSWAGTGGRTLKDLGYGHLGDYRRHVKDRVNALMGLADHTCVPDPVGTHLLPIAVMYGREHKGMPGWPVVVQRIGVLLADPDHPQWHEDYGHRALREMPVQVDSVEALMAGLLSSPSTLSQEVLDWLSDHLLYCAGPPYGPGWTAGERPKGPAAQVT
jgi:hypothetical protein